MAVPDISSRAMMIPQHAHFLWGRPVRMRLFAVHEQKGGIGPRYLAVFGASISTSVERCRFSVDKGTLVNRSFVETTWHR